LWDDLLDGDVTVGSTNNITIKDLASHVFAETGGIREPVHDAAKEADARHTRRCLEGPRID
jgi:hypothetical protein